MASVAVASGPVLMTAEEARRIIDQIRTGLENVRSLLLDLYEREGWKALGYGSFVECAEAEFCASKSQAYRLLDAARLDLILSPIGENGALPESHLRELKPVIDEPEAVRQIVAEVREEKGQLATAADTRGKVDRHLARPPRQPKARPSVSSAASAADFADDYVESFDQSLPDDDLGIAAEPAAGASLTGRGRAEASGATDTVEVTDVDACSIGDTEPAPTATNHASQAADPQLADERSDRANGKGSGGKGGSHAARSFSARPLDAGDLSRALLDLPIGQVIEAISENASADQKQALRAALGTVSQPAPAGSSKVTVKDVKALIRDHLTAADIRLLESELPMLRKEIGAREREAERALAVSGAAS